MKKIVAFAVLLVLIGCVYADMAIAYYPTIRFNVKFDGSEVKDEVFYYSVLSCYRNPNGNDVGGLDPQNFTEYDPSRKCTWGVPMVSYMMGADIRGAPWRYSDETEAGDLTGECSKSTCTGQIVLPKNGFRVSFYLPDENQNFVTNVATCAGCYGVIKRGGTQEGLNEEYDVSLFYNLTAVIGEGREIPTSPSEWFENTFHIPFALLLEVVVLNAIIELVVSFIYLYIRKLSKWILLSVAIANIISETIFTIILVGNSYAILSTLPEIITSNGHLSIIVFETPVVIFEFAVIFLMNRKRISMRDAFAMSLISNIASILIGIMLAPLIYRM